jgi:hypothetical protein
VYDSRACDSLVYSFSVASDSCYDFQFDSVNSYSATFGCAINLAGIPVTGNFAAVSLYNETESTCSSDPNAFLGLSIGTCFPSPFGPNDTQSFSFGCSYAYGGPDIHYYDTLECGEEVFTLHLDPSCETFFNSSINTTVIGYHQYQCVSIDVNPVYDDDIGTDDAIPPTGYLYLQYNTGDNCDGIATYYEGIAVGKCLLLYNEYAQIIGSVINECISTTRTQYKYSSNDCTGDFSAISTSDLNMCYSYDYANATIDSYTTLYGNSYEIICSSDDVLPMTQTTIVQK